MNQLLDQALASANETRHMLLGDGVINQAATLFQQAFADSPAVVVAEENTFAVAGQALLAQLGDVALPQPFVFPARPTLYADYTRVLELTEFFRSHQAIPVVVGSGTLNDLTKLAAHQCGRPYMCVATAASMDGYTAFGASITRDGYKQTMACPAPRAVLADVAILATAPTAMTAYGYADLLGKVTAGGDWLLADALGVEPLEPTAWRHVQGHLRAWLGAPAALRAGDRLALERLIEGLMLTGLVMQAYRSSRPASGSEHQFSHLWEMEHLSHGGELVSHGFKVGVGSLASAALYDVLLEEDLASLAVDGLVAAWPTAEAEAAAVRASLGSGVMAERAVEESLAKHPDRAALRARLERLVALWPTLQDELRAQVLPAPLLRDMLTEAGCPTTPEQIGLTRPRLKASYALARRIRRRYTIFDMAAETGLLDAGVERLFAPGGFWA